MFEFSSENFDLNWQNKDHKLDSSTWESNELRLKPLSNQPFDFFQYIHEDARTTLSEITNSTQSSRSSIHSESIDIWTHPVPASKTTLTWDLPVQHPISTPFITENPTRIFEPIIRQSDAESLVIYETELVRHLVQAIQGVPSLYFYWEQHELKRYKRLRILGVSAACVEPVIDRILLFSTRLKALEQLGQQYQAQPARYGLTGMAFGSYLCEFHLNIQHMMMQEMPGLTILQIQQWVERLFGVVSQLYALCQPELPFGAGILNRLYRELKPLDLIVDGHFGLYRDICFCFLRFTSVPYLNMLNQWLRLDGSPREMEDPYHEFFIQATDDKEVEHRYQIHAENELPYFIHGELASLILRSGVSLRLLEKNKPNHVLFQLDDSISLTPLLSTSDSEKYLERLNHTIQTIRLYSEDGIIPTSSRNEPVYAMHEDSDDGELCRLAALNKDILKDKVFSNKLKEIIMNQQKETIPSIDMITTQSYIKPLEIWCPLLNETLMKSIFLNEQQLEYHLSILYQYYLLGNGLFSNGLETILLSDISRSFNINIALKDLLAESAYKNEDELIHMTLSKDKQRLKLRYTVPYPFNILITKDVLDKYDRIFQFLVELCRLNAMMKKSFELLREIQFKNKEIQHQIHKYRFEFNQFIQELTAYVKSSIIESTWLPFIKTLKDEIMYFKEYQDFILDCILYPCFLKKGQVKIFEVLEPILKDISLFYQVLSTAQHRHEHEDKIKLKCKRIFEQFKTHTAIFIKVLSLLETKGSGRLSNILNTHYKYHHLDLFVKDLILRLNSNHFYQ